MRSHLLSARACPGALPAALQTLEVWLRRPTGGVWWLMASVVWLAPSPAAAGPPPSRVSVLTMGPSDHPFTRFGHNAILIEWEGRGPDHARVYNFGTFAFDGWNGATDFMTGRFRYWLSVSSLTLTLRAYGRAGRSLVAQELALDANERTELFASLERNAAPERRYYDYDYYADNCSTRVRDTLDRALLGELSRNVRGAARMTFRQHTLRLVEDAPFLSFGLDVALGRPTDRAITRWDELFLPRELHDELSRAHRSISGRSVPLVASQRVLLEDTRPEPASAPPERGLLYGALGLTMGAAAAALGGVPRRDSVARRLFGALSLVLGAALGVLGTALLIFALSKHGAAHRNPSLLGASPLALAVSACSVGLLRGRMASRWLVRWLGVAAFGSALLLVASLPSAGRESLRMAALFLPLWLGWLLGALGARRR